MSTPWEREYGGGLELWASKMREDPNDLFSKFTPHAPDGEGPVRVGGWGCDTGVKRMTTVPGIWRGRAVPCVPCVTCRA